MNRCLKCEKTEKQVPLLVLRFQGRELAICPQCLPVLIHKPTSLSDLLPGLAAGEAPPHDHPHPD